MSAFTDKAMIAAFYLKLARNQLTTDEEFLAAARRLGIVRWLFMLKYGLTEDRISEDRGVPNTLSWLGNCMVDKRFLELREKFEGMTQDHVLNYVGEMFKNDLLSWLDKREKLRKAEALAYKRTEDGKTSRLYKRFVKGDIVPDYTEPETEVSRIVSKAKVKTGAFARYLQWLEDHPNNENKAKLRMIKKEMKRRAKLWHEDPEAWKREPAENIKRLVEPLKYCGRNCTLLGAIPVNKTQTLAWAGHHQKPRKRKTSN